MKKVEKHQISCVLRVIKSAKMSTIYDEKCKLWSNSYQQISIDQEISRKLLRLLSTKGSKVAQVFKRHNSSFNKKVS